MKILISIFNIVILIFNIYALLFLKWLNEYKVSWKLDNIYWYIFLEKPIKEIYDSIEWQNIIIEKGSNMIIKEKIYQINKDAIISWKMSVKKWTRQYDKSFENKSIWELYSNIRWLNKIQITKFWNDEITKYIELNKKDIENIVKWDFKNTKTFNLY